jgi:hypothetical protein
LVGLPVKSKTDTSFPRRPLTASRRSIHPFLHAPPCGLFVLLLQYASLRDSRVLHDSPFPPRPCAMDGVSRTQVALSEVRVQQDTEHPLNNVLVSISRVVRVGQ